MAASPPPVLLPGWAPPGIASRWSAAELHGRVATLAAAETWLFSELGRGARRVVPAELKVLLDLHARHHAWHAELLAAQLPLLPAAGSAAPTAHAATTSRALLACSAAIEQLPEDEAGLGIVAVAYRVVVPRLLCAYAEQLEGCSMVGDAPVVRATELVRGDEVHHWEAGERVVQSLVGSPLVATRTAALVGRVEAAVVGAGGLLVGPERAAGGS